MSKRILVSDDSNSRIVILESPGLAFVTSFGTYGYGDGQFFYSLDACSDGSNIFATEYGHRIQKFTMYGTFVSKMGDDTYLSYTLMWGKYDFGEPYGIVTDGIRLYIADSSCGLIKIYDVATLTFIDIIGRYDWAWDSSQYCVGLAVYGDTIYVTDANREGAVLAVAKDSTFAIKYGANYVDSALFGGENCADATYLYVHNTDDGSVNLKGVYKYDKTTLQLVDSIGTGYATGGGICVDDTHVYVCEGATQLTKRLKSDLSSVATYPSYGDTRDFYNTYGCAVDDTYVYVCDYGNHKIVRVDKTTLTYHSEVDTAPQHGWPQFIAMNSTYIYVMSFGATVEIAKYDKATITLQAVTALNLSATGSHHIAIDMSDPDNSDVYVVGANTQARTWVLDKDTLAVLYTSGTGGDAIADNNVYGAVQLSLTPDGSRLLAAYVDSNTLAYNLKVF